MDRHPYDQAIRPDQVIVQLAEALLSYLSSAPSKVLAEYYRLPSYVEINHNSEIPFRFAVLFRANLHYLQQDYDPGIRFPLLAPAPVR
ncbi:hypothetical protein D3C73_1333150 [compost metagenome]